MKKLLIRLTNRLLKDSGFQIVERNWSYAVYISEQTWTKHIYVEEKHIIKQLFMVWVQEEEDTWPSLDWFSIEKFLSPNKNTDANTDQG
jgi:hypothetical protein